jgi:Flp pilus assembly pilin Flp
MDHGFGKRPPVRVFADEERGNAAIEMALLAALAAFFAFAMKHALATPLLNILTRATETLTRALGG